MKSLLFSGFSVFNECCVFLTAALSHLNQWSSSNEIIHDNVVISFQTLSGLDVCSIALMLGLVLDYAGFSFVQLSKVR